MTVLPILQQIIRDIFYSLLPCSLPHRKNMHVFCFKIKREDRTCIFDTISLATLPGMWDRTVTISSAGKTFSVTGWKVKYELHMVHFAINVLNE